ncbi:MAG TPA: helix-hairpin-helix domain-containing protein [Porticoccaceae bacterium]
MKKALTAVKPLSLALMALMLSGTPLATLAQQESASSPPAPRVQNASEQSAAVNINTASAEEIAAVLTGVGLTKAQAIVAWRESNGAFTRVEQLLEVKGIGQATLDKNVSRIGL